MRRAPQYSNVAVAEGQVQFAGATDSPPAVTVAFLEIGTDNVTPSEILDYAATAGEDALGSPPKLRTNRGILWREVLRPEMLSDSHAQSTFLHLE